MTDFLGGAHAVQWFFAAVSIVGFLFALIFLPETHGKSLAQIEAYFAGDSKRDPQLSSTIQQSYVSHRRATEHLIRSPSSHSFKIKEVEGLLMKHKEVA